MERQDENETALSLSFVDCISCGLAAAIFLFVLTGANVNLHGLGVGGQEGRAATAARGAFAVEPVDLEVQFDEPVSVAGSGWSSSRRHADRVLVADITSDGVATKKVVGFMRRLDHGFAATGGRFTTLRETALRVSSEVPPAGDQPPSSGPSGISAEHGSRRLCRPGRA
jgi:hypothetical protein